MLHRDIARSEGAVCRGADQAIEVVCSQLLLVIVIGLYGYCTVPIWSGLVCIYISIWSYMSRYTSPSLVRFRFIHIPKHTYIQELVLGTLHSLSPPLNLNRGTNVEIVSTELKQW